MTHEGTPVNGHQLDEATASIMVTCPVEGQDHGAMTVYEFMNSESTQKYAQDVLNNAAEFEKLGMEKSQAILKLLGSAAVKDPETQEVVRSSEALAEAQSRVEAAYVEVENGQPEAATLSDAIEKVQEQRKAVEFTSNLSKKK